MKCLFQLVEFREFGSLLTLWVTDQNNRLSAVHLTAPVPLRTSTNERVYARTDEGVLLLASERPEVIEVSTYYIVRDGAAYALPLDTYTGEVQIDQYTGVPRLPVEASTNLLELTAEELNQLPTRTSYRSGGLGDPEVFLNVGYRPLNERWNRFRTAFSQQSFVVDEPRFFRRVPINQDRTRHPGFCSQALTDEAASSEGSDGVVDDLGSCLLVGYDRSGLSERPEDQALRRPSEIDVYEGVTVTEERSSRMISGRIVVSYEGELPNSRSRSGYFLDRGENEWTFADYEADFCEIGVEPGDLWVADRFIPFNQDVADDPECAPFLNIAVGAGVDPLRYRVVSVSAHQLTLTIDQRESYAPQLDLLGSSRLPKIASAPEIPPYQCVAKAIPYSIRLGQDQWLVTSDQVGYRHAWVEQAGQCVQSPRRVAERRQGRATLGEVYQDEWLRFRLGFQRSMSGSGGHS